MITQKPKVLVIDDQWGQPTTTMIQDTYGALPYEFKLESSQAEDGGFKAEIALKRVDQEEDLAIVLLDIMFGNKNDRLGVKILEQLRNRYPVLPILMLTSVEEPETVIRCMELGANEYIVKRPNREVMGRILDIYANPRADEAIYGNSRAIRDLRAQIAKITCTPNPSTTVLIIGESGTGKELVAKAVWRQGRGMTSPFVAKNCANADSTLLDDELFGHERGAFTGAVGKRVGLLEEADEGVLFLDEIGSMPLELQGKLLRVLETRQIRRMGGNREIETDFQLIAATNREPEELLRKGLLREDFYFRLNQFEIPVPPLRYRKDDIPVLIALFVKKFVTEGGESYPGRYFSQNAMARFQNSDWKGNIRALRNIVESAIIVAKRKEIGLEDLPPRFLGSKMEMKAADGSLLPEDRENWGRHFALCKLRTVLKALEKSEGNATLAVKYLFPLVNTANATYLKRYVERLQKPPWGYSDPKDEEIAGLLEKINRYSIKRKKP